MSEEIRGQSEKISRWQALHREAQASWAAVSAWKKHPRASQVHSHALSSAALAGILAAPHSVVGNLAVDPTSIPCRCPLASWTGSGVRWCLLRVLIPKHPLFRSCCWHQRTRRHPIIFLKHTLIRLFFSLKVFSCSQVKGQVHELGSKS